MATSRAWIGRSRRTVEVTPDQGQRLALAQQAGRLSLSLRDPTAGEDAVLEAVSLADLVPEEPKVVEETAAEPAPRRTVVIRRAGVASAEEF